MKTLIVLSSIIFPVLMLYLKYKFRYTHFTFNLLAVISAIIFGNIASLSIYTVIADNTLFMTTIHGIFLNPLFISTGIYIGLYIIYRLLLMLTTEKLKD